MFRVYKIIPCKELMFGSLKHFVAGESHYYTSSESLNIMRFFKLVEDLKEEEFVKICAVGFFSESDGSFLVPLPADILFPRKGREGNPVMAKYREDYVFIKGTLEHYEYKRAYVKLSCLLKDYLHGRLDCFNKRDDNKEGDKEGILEESSILKREQKVGLGVDYESKTSKEGRLYFTQRLGVRSNYFLSILVEGKLREAESFVGAERTRAFVKDSGLDVKSLEELQNIKEGEFYKFYLLSHAFFDDSKVYINGIEFELKWIFSAGAEWISGWRKPALYMLRPGSVLVLRAKTSGNVRRLCQIEAFEGVINIIEGKRSFLDFGWNTGIIMREVNT